MWSNEGSTKSIGLIPGREYIGPLALMTTTPPFAIVLWHILTQTDGSLMDFLVDCQSVGFVRKLMAIWPSTFDSMAWQMIGLYMCIQVLLLRLVPGREYQGPITPAGNIPEYRDNGLTCLCLSILLYISGAYVFHLYPGGIVYLKLGEILSSLNVFSLVLCAGLYVKGRYAPSSTDSGVSGNMLFDFFWGTELYPRVWGCDIKMLTNCRWGMMFWAIGPISYYCYQYERFGVVSDTMTLSVALQLVYVIKFFHWESGYMKSIDIMHDRAGYYLCWGCLVWVPAVYTSPAMYLASRPQSMDSELTFWFIFVVGCCMIGLNYAIDEQRQRFRATNGKTLIWGKKPTYITAKYVTEKGEGKESLLLTCGFWGLSRHFHYVPEILAAFFWTIPCGTDYLLPFFYVIFLTILLHDRAFRDDARCQHKYGKDWNKYRNQVNCLIVPYAY